MSMPGVVDWYRQEVLPKGGDHELRVVGLVLGHICRVARTSGARTSSTTPPTTSGASSTSVSAPRAPGGPALAMALDRHGGRLGRPELLGAGLSRSPRCQQIPHRLPRRPATLDGPDLWLPASGEGQPEAPRAGAEGAPPAACPGAVPAQQSGTAAGHAQVPQEGQAGAPPAAHGGAVSA